MTTDGNNTKLNKLIIDLVKVTPTLFNGLGKSSENNSEWKRISNVLIDSGFPNTDGIYFVFFVYKNNPVTVIILCR